MTLHLAATGSAIQKRFRDEWFDSIETDPDEWAEEGPIGEGESQSVRVINKITGFRGIAKPGPILGSQSGYCRAAHEKLAFDLACMLGLPVCPVLLWPKDAPSIYRVGRSISAWAFPRSEKWDLAINQGLISPRQIEGAAAVHSAMRVFHTWIADTDRRQDHAHFDLSSPAHEARSAFYDHSNSLSFSWAHPNCPIDVVPSYMPGDTHAETLAATARAIATLDEDEIARLVHRIPRFYLPEPRRTNIVRNLLDRRIALRVLFNG
jgi:hypothetical protein